MDCLRCGAVMESMGEQEIQLGHHSFIFGDLSNLLSGSLDAEIFVCPQCKKLELFYTADGESFSDSLRND